MSFNGYLREELAPLCPKKENSMPRKSGLLLSAVQGKLAIDAGAVRALVEEGKSLLPIGITEVGGHFEAGAGCDGIRTG